MMQTADELDAREGSWPPDPPARSGDEPVASACCLECRRQIAKGELEITLTTLQPPEAWCPWCARPAGVKGFQILDVLRFSARAGVG